MRARALVFLLCCFGSLTAQVQPVNIELLPAVDLKGKHYRYTTDNVKIRGDVRDHKAHGKWLYWQKDLQGNWFVSGERNYWYGELNGRYFSVSETGDTGAVGNYHKGKKVGEWRSYYLGYLSERIFYDAQGYETGTHTWYSRDGKVNMRYQWIDTTHCYYWRYFEDGTLEERGEFCKGLQCGTWYEYRSRTDTAIRSDTLPIVIANYKDGLRHGQFLLYDNGVPVREENYYMGMTDSVQRIFRNGIVERESCYSRGRLHGPQRTFFENGSRFEEVVYNNNRLDSRHQYDSITGGRISSFYYTGERIDSTFFRTPEGTLVYSRKILAGTNSTYIEQRFYPDGAKLDSCMYVDHYKTGEYREWHANGKVHIVSQHNTNGYCKTLDIWNEQGVKVIHAMPSRYHDTIPERVWSDKGQQLQPGTNAYSAQLDKYLPTAIRRYSDSVFYLHRIVITARRPWFDESNNSGTAVQIDAGDSVATNKRFAPQFPGGEKAFQQYIKKTAWYPEMLREMGVQGSTWVEFTVNTDSTLSDFKVLKGVAGGQGCDKEAIRTLKGMPNWSPAKKNGKAYKSKCVVEFKWVLV